MLQDTLTTIENQYFDSLQAVQEPTIEAARKTAELLAQVPFVDKLGSLSSRLPSAEDVVARNFAFAQRLLDVQRDFALQLASASALAEPEKATAGAKKKSAA